MKLTDRELRVLYGLTRWPLMSRGDLAKWCGMGESSLSSVKGSLLAKGLISESRVAMPNIIGRGARGFQIGPVRPGLASRQVIERIDKAAVEHDITYMAATDGVGFILMGLKVGQEGMSDFFDKVHNPDIRDEGHTLTCSIRRTFDVANDIVQNVADHSGVLAFNLGLEYDIGPEMDSSPFMTDVPPPSPAMLKLIPYLVGPVGRSELEIAQLLGLTRQQVGKTRLDMERTGHLRKALKVNFSALGMDLFALFIMTYKDVDEDTIADYESRIDRAFRPLFWIRNGRTSVFQYPFGTLSDLKRFRLEILSLTQEPPIEGLEHILLAGRICQAVRYSPDLPTWSYCPETREEHA